MAKDSREPETRKEPTPFEKFERLAKRIAQVPKDRVAKPKEKPKQQSS